MKAKDVYSKARILFVLMAVEASLSLMLQIIGHRKILIRCNFQSLLNKHRDFQSVC